MNDLVTYIRAIHRQAGPAIIIRQQSEQHSEQDESGTLTHHRQTHYWFANGVVICHQLELDEESSPQLCPECWISYRVVTSPISITPARKLFHNPCQEAFWLKMQQITPAG
ncbi:hypothetical protein [Aeromonas hydrophila]|uniref:hypothetical protein n=1 Tax=Aeromonas hydrophila TaxID=644 RepID=UPI00002E4809|nr:hypothetical protein [Aeromonas hydrophila]MBW3833474.1 hypothetical protein [Aeromonas hydrophila]MBW5263640.1 hypothetical protein [Aeromonas hydrophila]MBW5278759.1 hypothetical protein [Aeromonas hydrophila]